MSWNRAFVPWTWVYRRPVGTSPCETLVRWGFDVTWLEVIKCDLGCIKSSVLAASHTKKSRTFWISNFFINKYNAGALNNSRSTYNLEIAEMAPTKKAKKTADSINSRLALVMKSGKGKPSEHTKKYLWMLTADWQSPSDTNQPSKLSDLERPSSSSSLAILLLFASPNLNTIACCPRLTSTTSLETTYVPLNYISKTISSELSLMTSFFLHLPTTNLRVARNLPSDKVYDFGGYNCLLLASI